MHRSVIQTAAGLILLGLAAPAAAGNSDLEQLFGAAVRAQAESALAVLGFATVPSETASGLALDTGQNPNRTYDFVAGQFGGGFRWSDSIPIYLEGYLGYNRYDPVLIVTQGAQTSQLPLKWTSVAATGGVGYEFDLSPYLVLRPLVHIALGRVQSDVSVGTQAIANRLGLESDALKNGGVTAGGLGGSLALVFNRRWENDYEFDASLRYTDISLRPIAGNRDLVAEARAQTATLWTRLRIPTGKEAFGRPVRTVAELSGSYLPGDQGEIIRESWLAQVGAGGEIDLGETWVPWVTTTRLMLRYTWGEHLKGYSIGIAASF
ncbi:MAG: autotransporter outer membrane beta-barrel domain-containing protein [Rhodobacteraceae bacterium]|nr:autotransporter outer membrane beta-barrel domain-containing protein [Paracoccaceae bacterium]